jgi:hypothetical protein
MTAIDLWTLDLTEWLCRRIQLLTGRTNVWLAAQLTDLSIVVYFAWVAMTVRVISGEISGLVGIAVALFSVGVLYLLSQTVFKVPIETSESEAYRRVANGLRNPRRVRDAQLRISFVTLSLLLLYPFLFLRINGRVPFPLLGYPLVVLTTIVLYMLACDPLPPSAARENVPHGEPVRVPSPAGDSSHRATSVRMAA